MEGETQRTDLAKNRAKNAITLPISRLLTKVLSEILLVVPIDYDLWASSILLRAIVGRSTLSATPNNSIDCHTEPELELWLSRSAPCPLHIRLCYEQYDPPEESMEHFAAAYKSLQVTTAVTRSLHVEVALNPGELHHWILYIH